MKNLDSYSSHADSVYVQKRLLKSKLHKKSTPQRDVNDGALPASVEEVQLHVGTVEKSPNLSDTVGDEGIEYEMDSHPTGVSLKKMQSAAQQRRFSLTQHSSPVKRRMIKKVHSLKELALESMSLPDENPVAKRDYQSPTNSTSSTVPQSPRMSSNLKSSSHKDHFSLFLHDSSSKCDETASKKVAKFENDKKLSQSCHGTSSSSKKNRRSDVERISATKSPMKTKNRTTAEARQLSMSQHRPQRKPLNVEKSPFKEKTQKSKSSTSSSAKQKAESMEDMQKLVAKLERQLACYKNEKRASSPSKIHSMNYSSSPTNTSIAPTTPRSPSKMGVLKKNYTATSAKVWSSLKLPWTLKSEPTSDIKETTGSLVET